MATVKGASILAHRRRTLLLRGPLDLLELARWPGRPGLTIITCEANELVRPVHDRMPVVFAEPELWQSWLHPSLDSAAARGLLAPIPPEGMVVGQRARW